MKALVWFNVIVAVTSSFDQKNRSSSLLMFEKVKALRASHELAPDLLDHVRQSTQAGLAAHCCVELLYVRYPLNGYWDPTLGAHSPGCFTHFLKA